jgi:hypothetical protein
MGKKIHLIIASIIIIFINFYYLIKVNKIDSSEYIIFDLKYGLRYFDPKNPWNRSDMNNELILPAVLSFFAIILYSICLNKFSKNQN